MDQRQKNIIEVALKLAKSDGWHSVNAPRLATAAKVSIDDLHRAFPRKIDILNGLFLQVDAEVLSAYRPSLSDTPKDRLFDLLMRRFDVLAPYRTGLNAIVKHPSDIIMCAITFHQSMQKMATAAQINERSAIPIGIAYLAVFRVWLSDNNTDLSKTMAALDRSLTLAMAAQLH